MENCGTHIKKIGMEPKQLTKKAILLERNMIGYYIGFQGIAQHCEETNSKSSDLVQIDYIDQFDFLLFSLTKNYAKTIFLANESNINHMINVFVYICVIKR